MIRWEYKRVIWKQYDPEEHMREAALNELGAEGWELVVYKIRDHSSVLYLKRSAGVPGKCASCDSDIKPDYLCEDCR